MLCMVRACCSGLGWVIRPCDVMHGVADGKRVIVAEMVRSFFQL
jgi:hypothetical protein